jgi:2-amino-4-hydroxy-6-hydroxymethyldihydropteridine diphosphokinase
MKTARCFIGLGSNLSTPVSQLQRAIVAIDQIAGCRIKCCSSFYVSAPMGPANQPDFVNAVVEISTQLTPIALLDALQTIEMQQGRVRKEQQWGPRTLDLDILMYDQLVINSERLTVPHYGMKLREFVLYPLHEIAPDLVLPCGNHLISVLNKVSKNGLKVIAKDIN